MKVFRNYSARQLSADELEMNDSYLINLSDNNFNIYIF